MPNPESALNEEAGKMLLERYDDYCQRAKMMTEIHAQVSAAARPAGRSGRLTSGFRQSGETEVGPSSSFEI